MNYFNFLGLATKRCKALSYASLSSRNVSTIARGVVNGVFYTSLLHCLWLACLIYAEYNVKLKTKANNRQILCDKKDAWRKIRGQSVLDVLEAFSKLVQVWKCEECNLQFNEADKFAKHQVEFHSPDLKAKEQFQCTDCRRVFVSQKGLSSHKRIHHNTDNVEEAELEEQGVMCVECRKICKDENALTSHMRLLSMDRKYPCKFCDFRVATPEKRKTHAELHTGDMKYVCFICEYQCSSENRRKQHKTSVKHSNMKEFLITGKPLIEEQSTSKKSRKVEKKRKQSSSSTDDIGSICDVCGDKFKNEDAMLKHKQTHPFIKFPNEDTPTRIFFK